MILEFTKQVFHHLGICRNSMQNSWMKNVRSPGDAITLREGTSPSISYKVWKGLPSQLSCPDAFMTSPLSFCPHQSQINRITSQNHHRNSTSNRHHCNSRIFTHNIQTSKNKQHLLSIPLFWANFTIIPKLELRWNFLWGNVSVTFSPTNLTNGTISQPCAWGSRSHVMNGAQVHSITSTASS